MIKLHFDENKGIVHMTILGKIRKEDIEEIVAPEADRIIADRGAIKGVLIDATGFDGWDSLPALMGHLGFVKEHHKFVRRLAIIGNATWQKILPGIASLFLEPDVKRFAPRARHAAEEWVSEQTMGS